MSNIFLASSTKVNLPRGRGSGKRAWSSSAGEELPRKAARASPNSAQKCKRKEECNGKILSGTRIAKQAAKFVLVCGRTAEREEQAAAVRYLGGQSAYLHGFHENATHVLVKELRRTEKFLCACAGGRWILKPAYIEACKINNQWLQEQSYEWNNTRKMDKDQKDLWHGAPRRWRQYWVSLTNPLIGALPQARCWGSSSQQPVGHTLLLPEGSARAPQGVLAALLCRCRGRRLERVGRLVTFRRRSEVFERFSCARVQVFMWLCGTRLQEQNQAGPFDKQNFLLLPGSHPPHDVLGKIIVSGRCVFFCRACRMSRRVLLSCPAAFCALSALNRASTCCLPLLNRCAVVVFRSGQVVSRQDEPTLSDVQHQVEANGVTHVVVSERCSRDIWSRPPFAHVPCQHMRGKSRFSVLCLCCHVALSLWSQAVSYTHTSTCVRDLSDTGRGSSKWLDTKKVAYFKGEYILDFLANKSRPSPSDPQYKPVELGVMDKT